MNIMVPRRTETNVAEGAAFRSRRGGAAVLLALSALTLVLGAPRLVASIHALPAAEATAELLAGRPAGGAAMVGAVEGLMSAGQWSDNPEYKTDLGLVLLHQALSEPAGESRNLLFAAAEKATAEGLAAGPGEPGVWARLAWLRHRRGDAAGALAALRMSWLSGAVIPSLMSSRLELAFSLHHSMNDEMLSLMRRQIRLAWVLGPDQVLGWAQRPGIGSLVSSALDELSQAEIARYLELHGAKR